VLAHASPEERLEQLLAARSLELEEQASRFEEAMADLERREELLRDMRASVERLLRLGTRDLTDRELELQELGREFLEREARLSAEEAEVNRRRSELGAVELKREAVEQRERALAQREREVDTDEQAATRSTEPNTAEAEDLVQADAARVTLLFVPGPAYRLVEVEHRSLRSGEPVEVDGEPFVVARVARSPLPQDVRVCAYLERESSASESGGSS
jgi:chromosome segregation ATPase